MTRLFVAVWPPDDIAAAIAAASAAGDEVGVRAVPTENLHITLRFLGGRFRGGADIDEVVSRLTDHTMPAARAQIGPTITALGAHAVLPTRGVDELAAHVRSATEGIGDPTTGGFVGHLTVARSGRRATAPPSVIGRRFEAAFDVDTVRLVESRLDAGGAVYRTVATFDTV